VNVPVLVLVVGNYIAVTALPRVFFKRGTFNLAWWLTALPFVCSQAFLLAAYFAHWRSWAGTGTAVTVLSSVASVLVLGSIALMFFTLGTHRVPLALWHQEDDAPASIVTYGAYSRIRHPFYTSFLLWFLAAFALFPHLGTLLPLCYAVVRLTMTAMREERRLSVSEFGNEYREYMTRTGRFIPTAR
jgi:protein-S-isoprenylcysteine O-methyltransferase Ste14